MKTKIIIQKILCFFGVHEWLYDKVYEERYCLRCNKKQEKDFGMGLHDPDRWVTVK